MTTTQIIAKNNDTDPYIELYFRTDYVDEFFDFEDFSILIAKTNSTDITCELCTHTELNLAKPFYTIDHSVCFCLSHLPTELLNEITLIL